MSVVASKGSTLICASVDDSFATSAFGSGFQFAAFGVTLGVTVEMTVDLGTGSADIFAAVCNRFMKGFAISWLRKDIVNSAMNG